MKRIAVLGLALLVILVSSLAALEQVRFLVKVWPFGLDASLHPNATNNLVKTWRSQSTLAVHYNPSSPQESAVFVGFKWGWAAQLILALGGLVAGGLIIWLDVYRGRSKAS